MIQFYDFAEIKAVGDCRRFAQEMLGIEINSQGRCQAIWRGGDGWNVKVDQDEWYDHKEKTGGGIIELCAVAKFNGNIQAAQNFLGEWLGLKSTIQLQNNPLVNRGTRYAELLEQGYKEVKRYDYSDLDGRLVHSVVRLEHPKLPKEFLQKTNEGWGLKRVKPILYRLADWHSNNRVLIVEGEKDADTVLDTLKLPATTCCGGASKWRSDYNKFFAGKSVAILADNDEAGDRHALLIAQQLHGFASSIRIICPSDLDKGDVTDWVDKEEGSREKLLKLINDAEEWEFQLPQEFDLIIKEMLGKQAGFWKGEIPEVKPELVQLPNGQGLFYRNELNELHGEPGLGKSWVALFAAKAILDAGGRVIYADPESTAAKLIRRLRILGCDESCADRFIHINPDTDEKWVVIQAYARMVFRPDLVVVDGVASYIQQEGGNEDVAGECLGFLKKRCNPFKEVAGVLLTDHVTKGSEGRGRWSRGSGAKLGEYKGAVYEVIPGKKLSPENGGELKLKLSKDNEGGVGAVGEIIAVLVFEPLNDGRTMVNLHSPDQVEGGLSRKMTVPEAKAHARRLASERAWMKADWIQTVQCETGRTATDFIKLFTEYALADQNIIVTEVKRGKGTPHIIGPPDLAAELKLKVEQDCERARQMQL